MKAGIFDRIERLAKFVQNLTIVFGVVAGAITIMAARLDKRIDHTIAFRKEYNESIRKDYLSFLSRWDQYSAQSMLSSVATQDKQKLIILGFFEDKDNIDSLRNISDFFYTLFVCINNRSCDRNTALELFRHPAQIIFEISAFYIFARRESDKEPTLGVGLEGIFTLKPEIYISRFL